jgi:hypothetical protein
MTQQDQAAISEATPSTSSKPSLLSRWFSGRLWIPVTAVAIFLIIAVVSFVASLH